MAKAAVEGATVPLMDRIVVIGKTLGVTKDAAKTLLKIAGNQADVSDEKLAHLLTKIASGARGRSGRDRCAGGSIRKERSFSAPGAPCCCSSPTLGLPPRSRITPGRSTSRLRDFTTPSKPSSR
jgi:hypothetical protein